MDEIGTHKQQWFAGDVGQGIGVAVAKVECRRVPAAPPEVAICPAGDFGLLGIKGDEFDLPHVARPASSARLPWCVVDGLDEIGVVENPSARGDALQKARGRGEWCVAWGHFCRSWLIPAVVRFFQHSPTMSGAGSGVAEVDKYLRVDHQDVHLAAAHVDAHADELVSQHGAAHERVATAQSGWIGAAAAALAARAEHWESETAEHSRELCGHSQDLRTAAVGYKNADTGAAATIGDVSSELVDGMGL